MRILHLLFLCLFSGQTFAQDTDTTVYTYVDKEAEFPGGYAAMMQWIQQNISFDSYEELDGTIRVSFIVEKDGSVSHAKAERSNYVSEAVAKSISGMPKWIPARNNGKICRSSFALPLNICFE